MTKEQVLMLNYLKNNLTDQLIKFIYKTKSGERRFASGTNHKAFIKKNFNIDLKDDYKTRNGLITYFDTDKRNWRSFKEQNLKDITHVYKLDDVGNFDYGN